MGTKTVTIHVLRAAAVLAAAVSCTERMNIDTRASEPVIVVYGELSDTWSFPEVMLSSSADYFSDEHLRHIYDADVWIESGGRKWQMSRPSDTEGRYVADDGVVVSAGDDYTLNIEVDFNGDGHRESYSAATRALPPVALDSIRIVPQKTMSITSYNILIYGQEPPERNFYIFQLLVDGELKTEEITDYLYMNDMLFNDTYLDGMLFGMYLSREHEDMIPPDRLEDTILLDPGDEVTLRVLNVEEGYYNFISQCKTERRGSNPFFGGPHSNIESNIRPAGAGYFAAYCTSEISATVPEEDN